MRRISVPCFSCCQGIINFSLLTTVYEDRTRISEFVAVTCSCTLYCNIIYAGYRYIYLGTRFHYLCTTGYHGSTTLSPPLLGGWHQYRSIILQYPSTVLMLSFQCTWYLQCNVLIAILRFTDRLPLIEHYASTVLNRFHINCINITKDGKDTAR